MCLDLGMAISWFRFTPDFNGQVNTVSFRFLFKSKLSCSGTKCVILLTIQMMPGPASLITAHITDGSTNKTKNRSSRDGTRFYNGPTRHDFTDARASALCCFYSLTVLRLSPNVPEGGDSMRLL